MRDKQEASQFHGASTLGSYHLIRLLGAGPLSRTYLAEREDAPGPQFALKIVEAVPLTSDQEQEQVLLAVNRLQKLQHPHVLPLLEGWIHEQLLCLVSPYAEAGSLWQRMVAVPGPPLPLKKTLALLKQIGEVLHSAHRQQIVHANLKPKNVLFQANGDALLADFRLSALMQSSWATRTHRVFGARYMAPEQFLQSQATPLSDQYSLACLACELLTGSPPFDADDFESIAREHLTELPVFPSSINREQVQHLESVILKALAKKPEERYADVAEFITALSAPPSLSPYIETAILPAAPADQNASSALILPGTPEQQAPADVPTINASPALILPGSPDQQAPADTPTVMVGPELQAAVLAGSQDQGHAYAASRQAAPPVQKPTAAHLSPKRFWLLAGLVCLAMSLSVSGLLVFLLSSSSGHNAANISQSRTTPSAVASATPNNAVAPASTAAGGTTPTPQPSPVVAPPTPSPSPAAPPTSGIASTASCAVSYKVTSQWSGGFVVTITITNSGASPISGWMLAFTFPGDQHVTNGWNGVFAQNGMQVSVSNESYNAHIQTGSSVAPGFQGAWNASNAAPTSFSLNGTACSASAG